MQKPKTHIRLLRSNSRGIQGTLENAKHHAEALVPFVRAMRPVVAFLGFKEWRQGTNIHVFITIDDRRFTLRPILSGSDDAGPVRYIGVRLSLRHGRSKEERLLDINKVEQTTFMLEMMRHLAKPQIGRDSRLMRSNNE